MRRNMTVSVSREVYRCTEETAAVLQSTRSSLGCRALEHWLILPPAERIGIPAPYRYVNNATICICYHPPLAEKVSIQAEALGIGIGRMVDMALRQWLMDIGRPLIALAAGDASDLLDSITAFEPTHESVVPRSPKPDRRRKKPNERVTILTQQIAYFRNVGNQPRVVQLTRELEALGGRA